MRATVPWLGMLLLAVGLGRALWGGLRNLGASRKFINGLRTTASTGHPTLDQAAQLAGLSGGVRLVENLAGNRAFTAGLLEPKIFATRQLCDNMPARELAAVLRHEEHHRLQRDPLRALIILFLQDLLFFLPLGYFLGQRFFEAGEVAADDSVPRPLELASALCQVSRLETAEPARGWIAGITGTGPIQRRVERLLYPGKHPFARPARLRTAISVTVFALLLTSLFLPVLIQGSPYVFEGCGPAVCAVSCVRR